jgi:hypothetical protein
MTPAARAFWLPIPVAATVALPAFTGADLQILGRLVFLDRLAGLAAPICLALWATATMPQWSRLLVAAAAGWCLAWLFLPAQQGFAVWPSYSYPAVVLAVAVACSLYQLVAAQTDFRLTGCAIIGLAMWIVDRLLMGPICGAMIGWQFTFASTACGEALGNLRAMIPVILFLAGYLAWLRLAGRR